MQVYPGKEHSITGEVYRTHLINRMMRFFDDNLKK
jgi:dipeptidyl aminopeptidase/acylaminoacyl peptidase